MIFDHFWLKKPRKRPKKSCQKQGALFLKRKTTYSEEKIASSQN